MTRKIKRSKKSAQSSHEVRDTRLSLIRAAERLMSERGVDVVSLRDICVEAGQGNTSAVAYHFGTRDALIDAILERHSNPIHQRWDAQLDLLERQSNVGLRPYVEMLVVEIAKSLDNPDGGWAYVSISAQLIMAPRVPLVERSVAMTPAVQRLMSSIQPFYTRPVVLLLPRYEMIASTIYTGLVAQHRREKQGTTPVSREAFVSDLIDALIALITQKPSPETLATIPEESEPW
jgi:AcrR family transcriptional regulator